MHTRFILIETSHAGNVGAAARAMKVMGFDDLVLVRPRWANVLRREETIQRASGATDVLERCRIVETLEQALDGIHHLCATAMTPRDFGPPTHTPRAYFDLLLKREQTIQYQQGKSPVFAGGVGFLFGSERYGMRNEDVYRCHVCLSIPTQPGFGSLNLASALQVIAYEWRLALGGFGADVTGDLDAAPAAPNTHPQPAADPPLQSRVVASQPADAVALAGLLSHWEQALTAVGFLNPEAPKKLMPRLNQLFNRASLTAEEVHILRGVAKAMLQAKR